MFVLSVVPQVYGRTRLNLYVVAAAVAANTVLSLILLRTIGILGPATAFACSTYLAAGMYFVVTKRLLNARATQLIPLAAIGRTTLAALLATLPAFGAAAIIPAPLVALAAAGMVFGVVYLVAAYLLGVFNPSDINVARSWLRRLIPAAS